MASLAKNLMDIYYAEERNWLQSNEFEIASAYSDAESMVNNLMHGRPDAEWVPQFVKIMRDRAHDAEASVAEHFEIIAALAEDSIS